MTYTLDGGIFGGEAPAGSSESPAAVTFVLVSSNDDVHILRAPVDPDGASDGDPPPISTETLATLLEKTADSLRRGVVATSVRQTGSHPDGARNAGDAGSDTYHFGSGARAGPGASKRLRVGALEILPQSRLVVRQGEPVPLSRIEFDLFLALVRRDGRPATRLELVREVWGFGAAVTSRSVDTQIYNLRHKLEENPANPRHVLTVSGVGYRVAR